MMDGQRYRWQAIFSDGTRIAQSGDDHYSKHDPAKEHNPSAFRDVEEKRQETPLVAFSLIDTIDDLCGVFVDLETHTFYIDNMPFRLPGEEDFTYVIDSKPAELIYYRTMEQKLDGHSKPIVKSHTIGYRSGGKDYVIVVPDSPFLDIVKEHKKH